MATVHVIGAGMAGLSCAVELVKARQRVVLWEAAAQAGRPLPLVPRRHPGPDHRQWQPPDPGRQSRRVRLPGDRRCARRAGGPGARGVPLRRPGARASAGPFAPMPGHCPGGSWHRGDACRAAARAITWRASPSPARGTATPPQSGCRAPGRCWERLWEPLTVAVLNASVEEASARLLWPVVRLTFGRGEAACRAYLTRVGLGPDLVEPGVRYVERGGGRLLYNRRLRAIQYDGRAVTGFDIAGTSGGSDESFAPGDVRRARGDAASLRAAPARDSGTAGDPAHRQRALPARPAGADAGGRRDPRRGGRHGAVDFCARRHRVRHRERGRRIDGASGSGDRGDAVGRRFPGARLQTGRHACGSHREGEARDLRPQIPAALPLRPPAETRFRNLFLAGDWTATGLPATIEGAVRSGVTAARRALGALAVV